VSPAEVVLLLVGFVKSGPIDSERDRAVGVVPGSEISEDNSLSIGLGMFGGHPVREICESLIPKGHCF